MGPLEDSTLIVHKLCPMVSPVCATPEYLEQYGKPDTPDELVNHKCLLLAMPGFTRSNWKFTDKQGHTKEVAVNEFLCTSNAIALKENTAALDEAAAWVLYPSRNYVPQKVRVFVDFFKEKFQAGAPWDQSARGN
ncbi:MAG: hypothetical protein BRC54_03660 [Cyanobacteria bacterium SW_7_48_12]|nr:MAG: hypothetical protein BRC54_03660 [Cyanobacteria bacterium SW_7_48_12]